MIFLYNYLFNICQLLTRYSSWSDQLCLPLTLSIGSIALRKQTINAYLAMLGYGPTPRSSPSQAQRDRVITTQAVITSNVGLVDGAPAVTGQSHALIRCTNQAFLFHIGNCLGKLEYRIHSRLLPRFACPVKSTQSLFHERCSSNINYFTYYMNL